MGRAESVAWAPFGTRCEGQRPSRPYGQGHEFDIVKATAGLTTMRKDVGTDRIVRHCSRRPAEVSRRRTMLRSRRTVVGGTPRSVVPRQWGDSGSDVRLDAWVGAGGIAHCSDHRLLRGSQINFSRDPVMVSVAIRAVGRVVPRASPAAAAGSREWSRGEACGSGEDTRCRTCRIGGNNRGSLVSEVGRLDISKEAATRSLLVAHYGW